MAEWDEAPEWRRAEAKQFTPEERSNLRSWGFDVLEPPAPVSAFQEPLGFARNLGAITSGKLSCLKCPETAVAGSNYCPKHRPRGWAGCTGSSHDASCTLSPKPGGLCGGRASSLLDSPMLIDQYHEKMYRYDALYGVRTISGGPA